MFDMKFDGFDKIQKSLDNMVNDVEPPRFAVWANKIEETAREMCNDADGKRITFQSEKGTTKISIIVSDKEALQYVEESIKYHLDSMSLGLKAFYQQSVPTILKDLETQLERK